MLGRAPPSRASRNLESSHDLPRSPTISLDLESSVGAPPWITRVCASGGGPKVGCVGGWPLSSAAFRNGLPLCTRPVKACPPVPERAPPAPPAPPSLSRRSRHTRTDASWRRVERHAAQRTAQRFDTQQLAEIRIDILTEMIVARQHAAATPPAAVGAPPETAVRVASVSGQRIIVKPHL